MQRGSAPSVARMRWLVSWRPRVQPAVDGHGLHVTCVAVDFGEARVGGCVRGLIPTYWGLHMES